MITILCRITYSLFECSAKAQDLQVKMSHVESIAPFADEWRVKKARKSYEKFHSLHFRNAIGRDGMEKGKVSCEVCAKCDEWENIRFSLHTNRVFMKWMWMDACLLFCSINRYSMAERQFFTSITNDKKVWMPTDRIVMRCMHCCDSVARILRARILLHIISGRRMTHSFRPFCERFSMLKFVDCRTHGEEKKKCENERISIGNFLFCKTQIHNQLRAAQSS